MYVIFQLERSNHWKLESQKKLFRTILKIYLYFGKNKQKSVFTFYKKQDKKI